MQVHEEHLEGDRPVPPPGCPGLMDTSCPGKVHLHQYYFRNCIADGEREVVTACFRCSLCFAHFSVIPAGMMPYRPVASDDAQRFADQRSRLHIPDSEPPLPAENVSHFSPRPDFREMLQSFWSAFSFHSLIPAGILGIALDSSPATVWRTLRHRYGTISDVYRALQAHHTSLTKSYLSLKPWWLGGLARDWRAIVVRAP